MPDGEGLPELLTVDADGHPMLLGMICGTCGHVAFPEQPYGCEKCGETANIQPRKLPCRGMLSSFATVNLHRSERIATPFIIGEVKLESGPTIRITMLESSEENLVIGLNAHGVLFKVTDPAGGEHTELRFTMGSSQ